MNVRLLSVFAASSILGLSAAEEQLANEEQSALEQQSANFKPTQSLSPAERCVRELEGVIYQPVTAAKLYLDQISEQIKLSSPLLWTNQAESFIKSVEQKYQVKVNILDPFRNALHPYDSQMYYSTTSTANMNGNGFAYDADKDQRVMYEFIVFNCFGELKYVLITMPLADAPAQFCK